MIATSYIIQIICAAAGIAGGIAGYIAFTTEDYVLVIVNSITVPINIASIISLYYSRKRFRELRGPAFSKHDHCSCGACDWGTVTRQYDEVPVCRNCWNTWKGK